MINHQYLTSQGIYGVAVGVVATYVFHFVLFGVMATRIGLGQLFLDIAASVAGRYAGGPAKVSVFGSAMFGMLSRLLGGQRGDRRLAHHPRDDPRRLQARVRRRRWKPPSSTGGQITPPVLGAAAFLMVEFLNVSYQTIIAAAVGAGLHALLRRLHAGALRGQALRPARPDRRRDAEAARVACASAGPR